jgi:hypothetical protein
MCLYRDTFKLSSEGRYEVQVLVEEDDYICVKIRRMQHPGALAYFRKVNGEEKSL